MTTRTAHQWTDVLTRCGVRLGTATQWGPFFAEVVQDGTFSAGDTDIAAFLGQVLHESGGLERLEESLYYSTPGRLMATWPSRFKSEADEVPYLRNPEALANKVYGGRMGNTAPGDGWRNRGSGLIQITGADNLRAVQATTGIPVYDHPELLRKPSAESLRVCIAWWEGRIPDSALGDTAQVSRLVNGGALGLADRQRLTDLARRALV